MTSSHSNRVHVTSSSYMGVIGKVGEFAKQFLQQTALSLGPWPPNNKGSLPALPKVFGREDHIDQVVHQIETQVTPLAILGPPGIGKSAIAGAVVHDNRVIERFGDFRHWVNCGEVKSLDGFLVVLYKSLGMPHDRVTSHFSDDPLHTIVQTLTRSKAPQLMVLDDFEATWESIQSDASHVLKTLCAISHLTLIFTMRGAAVLPPVGWRLRVPPLSPRAARLTFLTICPKSDDQLPGLLQKVDYLPLAVTLLAHVSQTSGMMPSELTELWNKGKPELFELQGGGLHDLDNAISLSVKSNSMRQNPNALRLLGILSILPGGAFQAHLRDLAPGIDIDNVARLVTGVSLAFDPSPGRLQLLAPIRSHFLEYYKLDDKSRDELYSYYFARAKQGLRRPGDKDFPRAIRSLLEEQSNIEAILDDALEKGCVIAINAALEYSTPLCAIRPRTDIMEKALELARKEASDPLIMCRCHQRLGEMYNSIGHYLLSRPHLDEAITLFRKHGFALGVAECLYTSVKGIWINSHEGGILRIKDARREFCQLGNRIGEYNCLLELGKLSLEGGRLEEGRSALEDALKGFRELGDPASKAQCHNIRARIYLSQNCVEDARSAFGEALYSFEKLGDRSAMAEIMELLAFIHLHQDHVDDFQLAMKNALFQYEYLGRRLAAAFCMWNLGRQSLDDEAILLYQKAIPEFWAAAFVYAGAECRLSLGQIYIGMGDFTNALLHLEIARKELINNGTQELAALCLKEIIVSLLQDGQTDAGKLAIENGRVELLNHGFLQNRPRLAEASETVTEGEDI